MLNYNTPRVSIEDFVVLLFSINTQIHEYTMSLSTNEIILYFCELFERVLIELGGTQILLARTYVGNIRMFGMHILNWRNRQRVGEVKRKRVQHKCMQMRLFIEITTRRCAVIVYFSRGKQRSCCWSCFCDCREAGTAVVFVCTEQWK